MDKSREKTEARVSRSPCFCRHLSLVDHTRSLASELLVPRLRMESDRGSLWPILSGSATSSEPLSPDVIRQRNEAGWQMVAIEWRRERPGAETPAEGEFDEDIPYGLRVSDDCMRLEADPIEHQVLMLIMEGVALDSSYAEIAARLNEKGFRTRSGQPWNRVAVFGMIPRLIDVGPRIFSSTEWVERLQQFESPRPTREPDPPATRPQSWRGLFGRKSRA